MYSEQNERIECMYCQYPNQRKWVVCAPVDMLVADVLERLKDQKGMGRGR